MNRCADECNTRGVGCCDRCLDRKQDNKRDNGIDRGDSGMVDRTENKNGNDVVSCEWRGRMGGVRKIKTDLARISGVCVNGVQLGDKRVCEDEGM